MGAFITEYSYSIFGRNADCKRVSGGLDGQLIEHPPFYGAGFAPDIALNGMKFILGALTLLSFGAIADESVFVRFWPTKVKPPANVLVDDHPCGTVLTIRTTKVPRNVAWLEADVIHEIDESGRILRTWRVPIDHYPVGVEGDNVHLALGSEPESVLTVSIGGRLRTIHSPPVDSLKGMRACPSSLNKNFLCEIVTNKPLRMLAYAPVCS